MKFDPYNGQNGEDCLGSIDPSKECMHIQYMWNISLNHHQVADTFIVCGGKQTPDNIYSNLDITNLDIGNFEI